MAKPEVCVQLERLSHAEGLPLPRYMTRGSSGMDVAAALEEPITLIPGGRALVPTGFKLAIPEGFECQVRPRSGLAFKHGVTLLNTPGTIDSDYRGELKLLLINLGQEPFTIQRGDRIAQLVFASALQVTLSEVTSIEETARNGGGFGHTGIAG